MVTLKLLLIAALAVGLTFIASPSEPAPARAERRVDPCTLRPSPVPLPADMPNRFGRMRRGGNTA